ncbi:HAD family hydrolase [Deinococcus ficus]|uniref:hypothetical protein n=1 Tax=Deinococcus ficus TaxID=317577 RepID=UPI0003B72D2D|nr:hypothetical protein [Deinococcus ficus]
MILAFVNPEHTLLHPDAPDEFARVASGLSALLREAELIPVTGLDEEGLLAVPAVFTSWQVLLHGAVVLTPDGLEDHAWRRLTLETQAAQEQAMTLAAQAATHLTQLGQLGVDVEVVRRNGLPLLVRVTHPHGLPLALDEAERGWREWLDGGPFQTDLRVLRTGETLTLLPKELTPDSAVNFVLSRLDEQPDLTLGVGAFPSDVGFLEQCDLTIVPPDLLRRDPATEGDED